VSFNDFFVEKVIKHNVSFPPDTGTETGDMTGSFCRWGFVSGFLAAFFLATHEGR